MLTINTNTSSMRAAFQLNRNKDDQNTVMRRLATGKKINSGRDGPAALIASVRLEAEIRSLEAESKGLERSISNSNIADGRVSLLSGLYGDLNALEVRAADGTLSKAEKAAVQFEIDSVVSAIDRFTGQAIKSIDKTGMPESQRQALADELNKALSAAQSVASGGVNDMSSGNFEAAQAGIQDAITASSTVRGSIGSFQKYAQEPRLRSNQIALINLSESRSRIADADFAVETSNLARSQVLVQSGIAMLKITQQQAKLALNLLA